MESFFDRYRNPLVLAILLAGQLFLLAVQVRRPFPAATAAVDHAGVRALRYGVTTVVTPPESVLHKSGLSIRDVWSSYLDLIGVRRQNAELKEEVDQLRMEQASLAEDAREGERLQDLLAFRQHYISTTVPAQVVGTSGTDRSRVLYLDKGSADGIAVDMPVITPNGIVGKVRDVFPHTAQVLEVSDPTSATGVLLEETRTRGILRGNAAGQPQIVNLMPDDRIKPGQVVLTSGGDQIFPRGLPVGVVSKIVPDPDNEPMVDVILKPAANLGQLEEVLVVTSTAPAPSARSRRDLAKSESAAATAEQAKEAAAKAAALAAAQRASDILAQRLPSREDPADPDAPDAVSDASPATSEADARPLHPPAAIHADHYTPADVPSASSLSPGERYAPLAEGTPATERRPARTDSAAVNATDAAPVANNPSFAAASAAVLAQRKAIADAKAAAATRRYEALHPVVPVVTTPGEPGPTAASSPTPGPTWGTSAVLYSARTNANGTVTRVPLAGAASLGASGAGAVRYVNRTNADGTVTRVAMPAGPGGAAVRYTTRTNADGSVTRVPVPVPTTASVISAGEARSTTRTNADGTVTRVPMPAATEITPSRVAAVRYTTRTNADGSVTRIPASAPGAVIPNSAGGARSVAPTNTVGTGARTSGATSNSAAALRFTTRTNADGTVTRLAVPTSSLARSPQSSAAPRGTGPAASRTRPVTAGVQTTVVEDGPLPRINGAAAKPRAPGAAAALPSAAAPKRKSPELVPDDGSQPPHPQPAARPQERP